MTDSLFRRLITTVPRRIALEHKISYLTKCYQDADAALRKFNQRPAAEQDPSQRAFLERNLAGSRKALIDATSQRANPPEPKAAPATQDYLRHLYHLDRYDLRGRRGR